MAFAKFGNDLYSGRRSLPFVGRRRLWYVIAVAMMLISVIALATLKLNEGIEFRGGSQFDLVKVSSTNQTLATDAVSSAVPGAVSRVSKAGTSGIRVQVDKLDGAQTDRVKASLAKAYKIPADNVT